MGYLPNKGEKRELVMKSFTTFIKTICAIAICQAAVFAKPSKVLHLYAFGERPHGSAQQPVVDFMNELAQEHSFEVTHMKKSSAVETIEEYDVVLFNSTAFGAFTKPAEQEKLKTWLTGGGKAIGFHSTCDIRGKWDWWGNEVCGGSWYDDDFFGAFTLETDKEIEKLPGFKEMWTENQLGDEAEFPSTELYVYNANPRGKTGITMFHTVGKDFSDVEDHPFGWHKTIGDSGEFIYSALGHQKSDFASGWMKKATWAWMKYLTGDYKPVSGVDGKPFHPFARLDVNKSHVHIKDVGRHSVRVFDLQGRLRYDWRGTDEQMYAYQGLDAGIYYLQVKSRNLDYKRAVIIQ
jgi:type 1 glutamine amidotransferase